MPSPQNSFSAKFGMSHRAKTQLLGGSRLHDKHADNPGDHQHRTNDNGPIATQMMRSLCRRGRHQISTCCESDNSKTDDNIVNYRILHEKQYLPLLKYIRSGPSKAFPLYQTCKASKLNKPL